MTLHKRYLRTNVAVLAGIVLLSGCGQAATGDNQAEDVLLEDMPIIPLFFAVAQSVHSTDVTDVVVDAFGRVDTSALTATA